MREIKRPIKAKGRIRPYGDKTSLQGRGEVLRKGEIIVVRDFVIVEEDVKLDQKELGKQKGIFLKMSPGLLKPEPGYLAGREGPAGSFFGLGFKILFLPFRIGPDKGQAGIETSGGGVIPKVKIGPALVAGEDNLAGVNIISKNKRGEEEQ